MGGFIILAVFAIVGIFISKANKIAKKEMSGKSFGENFPFPTLSDIEKQRPFDPWDMSDRGYEAPAHSAVDEMVVNEVEPTTTAYQSIDMSKHNVDTNTEAPKDDKIEFDLRQAVIYSEILKPKFME